MPVERLGGSYRRKPNSTKRELVSRTQDSAGPDMPVTAPATASHSTEATPNDAAELAEPARRKGR